MRERKYGSIRTKVVKDTLDYQAGSVEMKANSMFEPVFTEWLLQNLPMPRNEAIYSGAQIAGCNPITCERYLKKLTSAAGPLMEFKNAMRTIIVDFKSDIKQAPTDSAKLGKQRCRNVTEDTKPKPRRKNNGGHAVVQKKLAAAALHEIGARDK